MKRRLCYLLCFSLGIMAFRYPQHKKVKIFLAGDSTLSVKESKYFPETGWGMPFVYFWDTTVTVVNKAKNGRSTKTFISEGLWQSILDESAPGDYVFIQFGHNDEVKEKVERYTTPEEYTANLLKFVNEARQKGLKPLLLTPVSRRKFDAQGKALQTHELYSELVRSLARKETVLLIDADELSRFIYQQMGEEHSKLLFLHLKPGEHPNYPDGKTDNTHFSELGARLVAQHIFREVLVQFPELARHMVRPIKK